MFSFFKNFFSDSNGVSKSVVTHELTIGSLKQHFLDKNSIGFKEKSELIQSIFVKKDKNKRNIFILDDVCEIVEILKNDFEDHLKKINRLDDFNIFALCTKTVGFDMLSIIVCYPEITVDVILTDIVFGGNEKLNGKKIIVDGVDVVIAAKQANNSLNFVLFTGNVLTQKNENNYDFSKKFNDFFGESISKYAYIKDTDIIFDGEIFDKLISGL